MKGVFTKRPSLPKYKEVWDINIVLTYIDTIKNTTLLQLTQKLCMLFLLLTAQRCQTLHLIEMPDIIFQPNSCTIHPNHVLKQSKPGHHLDSIHLNKYGENPNRCLVKTLEEYIQRTAALRNGEKRLLISTQKPHKPVSKQTVSRWVKMLMSKAGISHHYGAHSTRAASTSAARLRGVLLSEIIKTAGWKSAQTFARFYNKEVNDKSTYQSVVQH